MKKLIPAFTAIALFASVTIQAQAYQKGRGVVQLGLGLGSGLYSGYAIVPPLQLRYDHGFSDEISIGGIVGYASSGYDYYTGYSWSTIEYAHLLIGARGNYHFNAGAKFDPYVGLNLGYHNISIKDKNDSYFGTVAASGVFYGGQVGVNYYFTPNLGAWAELGYGVAYLNFGLAVKL